MFKDIDTELLVEKMLEEHEKREEKIKKFVSKELEDPKVFDKIIKDMDRKLMMDCTTIAYHEHKYSVTRDEFEIFISVIAESGVKIMDTGVDTYFPTVVFPIYYKNHVYTLTQMTGQGTVYFLEQDKEDKYINKAIPYENILKSVIKG